MKNTKPDRAGLFDVKLRGRDVAARKHGGERATSVIRRGKRVGGVRWRGIKRVNKINVGVLFDAIQERMRTKRVDLVPTHVRNFVAGVNRREAFDLAGENVEQRRAAVLLGTGEKNLRAEANAEKRNADGDSLAKKRDQARGVEVAHRGGGGADTGKNQAIRGAERVKIAGDARGRAQGVEGILDAGEIACAVVDNGGHEGF